MATEYLYYPGCSMDGTGKAYRDSIEAVLPALRIGLAELDDWNCCGATEYMGVSPLRSQALVGRNLALVGHRDRRAGSVRARDRPVHAALALRELRRGRRVGRHDRAHGTAGDRGGSSELGDRLILGVGNWHHLIEARDAEHLRHRRIQLAYDELPAEAHQLLADGLTVPPRQEDGHVERGPPETEAEVVEAARIANAHEFTRHLLHQIATDFELKIG